MGVIARSKAKVAELADARERLARAEARLDEIAAALAGLQSPDDDIARVQSVAQDGLARASNAQAIAEDALARVVETEGRGVDALARASNAQEIAEHALARAAKAGSLGEDAMARADNAQATADEALRRMAEVEGRDVDALARATNAQAIAEDALGRAADGAAQAKDALARAEGASGLADDALQRAGKAHARADDAAATAAHALDTGREALLAARIAALESWLELVPPVDEVAISVVLPTRDRPALLPRAIASMLEQLYERWELIVVDDGDTDAVDDVLSSVEDERIVRAQGPRRGLGAARNAGLDVATGDIVCYLDDDNAMHPRWLQAVAHVFSARDDVDVLYGVAVAEHRSTEERDEAWWPSFWQLPWSRELLLEENLTDAGALAHRRTLDEARFDEALGEDWDLLIRLTVDRPALPVPAISHAYSISGGDHMSRESGYRESLEQVRQRHVGE